MTQRTHSTPRQLSDHPGYCEEEDFIVEIACFDVDEDTATLEPPPRIDSAQPLH